MSTMTPAGNARQEQHAMKTPPIVSRRMAAAREQMLVKEKADPRP